jgi:peptidoglycan/LPS O-acetylase OafA/YrhL
MQGLDDKRLSYLPGLDGLRALAVMAVLLFHAGQRWIPGGFLGVEVFFVISGYLITCVLLENRERTGSVGLKQFWFRRARRLLPALFALLLGTLAVSVVFYPDEVAKLRGDSLAALGYITNWYFILDHQSYFDEVGRPSLVRHLWSLAIEEQFYLVWPVVLALLVGRLRTVGMVALLLAGAAASSVLMALLWDPEAGPARVYYGTDTRAAGLLMGAALAFVWAPWRLRWSRGRAYAIALNSTGLAALAGLIYLHVELDQYRSLLYHGGFALVSLSTAVLIAVVVHPSARLGQLLGLQPLRWLGTRSYAVYLWHWPVFMLTRPGLDVSIDGWELLGLRLGITFILAEVSYRLVERPIRSGALGRAWRAFRDGRGLWRWAGGLRWSTPLGAAATSAAVLAAFAMAAEPPAPPEYLSVESVRITSPPSTQTHVRIPAAVPVGTTANQGAVVSVPVGSPPGRPGDAPTPIYGYAPDVAVTVLGDSVMVGAAQTLAAAIPGADIDAAIGRQAQTALDILQQRRGAQALGDAVIIHIGNNGSFTAKQFDAMMLALADRRVVIFVNVKVPRSWEEPNNEVIGKGVKRYGNAALVDWHGASVDRPELFQDDGIHLRGAGVQLYASLITKELAAHPPPPPPPSAVATTASLPPEAIPADIPVPAPPPSPQPVPPTGTPTPTYSPTPTSPPTTPPPPPPTPPPTPPPPATPPPTPPPTPEPTPPPTPEPTPPPTPEPTPPPTPEPTPTA